MIQLDATLSSDLIWEANPEATDLFLDLGLNRLELYNQKHLSSRLLAVTQCVIQFPQARSIGFAKITAPFEDLLHPKDRSEGDCPQRISDYLHRLAAELPDEMTPYIVVDLTCFTDPSKLILPLCERRFEHFQIRFEGGVLPIRRSESLAVSLPEDELFDLEKFSKIFQALDGRPFTCIPEELLNEHWDGLDQIIIDADSLGEKGKRMLFGFEAAGGEIISNGPLPDFKEALDLNTFRSRGI